LNPFQVMPGVQLIIGLCHSGVSTEGKSAPPPPQNMNHDHVLEHSLHQLLREIHHKNTHHPFPHPSSGPIGPSKRRCLAGPCAADRHELLHMTQGQCMLEQVCFFSHEFLY
jgi:mediator of RNA polymerase II transcription subunit 17